MKGPASNEARGGDEAERRARRGALPLLLTGVVVLVLGALTGLPSGMFLSHARTFADAAQSGVESSRQQWNELLASLETEGMEDSKTARDRADVKRRMDTLRDINRKDAMHHGIIAWNQADSTRIAEPLGHVEAFLKFLYIPLAFAIFLRLRAARKVGLCLALAHLAVLLGYVMTMGASVQAFADAAGPLVDQVVREQQLADPPLGFVQTWAGRFPWGFAGFSSVVPVLLLLVLRRADGPARHLRIVLFSAPQGAAGAQA